MESNIRALVHRRAVVKGQITRFKNFLEDHSANHDNEQLEERLVRLKSAWQDFDEIQTKIENLDSSSDVETHIAERKLFEDMYFELVAEGQRRRSVASAVVSGSATPINITNPTRIVKLPPINLPTFDSNYDAWLCFFDSFKSIIHDNDDIKPVQKLQYLRSCLKGDAARIIESLSTSAENYGVAWGLLRERFDNKRIITQNHVRLLFELPNITKESSQNLQSLVDNALKHIRALKALELPTDYWDVLLIHLLTSKLDKRTHTEWERSIDGTTAPSIEEFWKFLRNRCHILENVSFESAPSSKVNKVQLLRGNNANNSNNNKAKSNPCAKCKRRHNVLLHPPNTAASLNIADQGDKSVVQATASLQTTMSSQVLLSTALIEIYDQYGKAHRCRVLLDSGSQSNFITVSLANRLRLGRKEVHVPVSGFGNALTHIKHSMNARIRSNDGRFYSQLCFLVVPRITERLPTRYLDRRDFDIPRNIRLADPEFCKPSEIDALIGAECFYQLLCVGQIKFNGGSAILQKTRLGWVVSGRVHERDRHMKPTVCNVSIDALSSQISKFRELEEIPETKYLSDEQGACEEHFKKYTVREKSGRYCVKLPFNEKIKDLGASYQLAQKRLYMMERRLLLDEPRRTEYSRCLEEYIALGHMVEIKEEDACKKAYFLPHHAVIKHGSLTTKMRVVFDASAKTSTGVSLNDTLMVGPNIQDDIFSMIARFRSHCLYTVLTADIEKMYRQINIYPEDTKYQQILWRGTNDEAIRMYRLRTVTYGTAAGSFLAIRCLHQLAEDEEDSFPLASRILKRDFYVDDLLTGTSDFEEALRMRNELIELLRRGGFYLRQWASNDRRLITDLAEQCTDDYLCLDNNETVKTLGIRWNCRNDTIIYVTNVHSENDERITKRAILSQIAAMFDPIGLLGPIIAKAKFIMQRLWQLRLEWDESVPIDINTTWIEFKTQLKTIKCFSFPRKTIIDECCNLQLHGFCDASEKGFGACIYLRSMNGAGHCISRLVCAKHRVAPIKKITIPRLELCAAALLAKLYVSANKALNRKFDGVYFWSDSTIVLHWIASSPHRLQTFVANRVAQIQVATDVTVWRHVPSADNPADMLSRGHRSSRSIQYG